MIICSPENVDDLKSESSEEKNSVQTKVFGVKTVYGSTRQFHIWMGPVISYLSRLSDYGNVLGVVWSPVQVLSVVILYLSRTKPNLNIKDSISPGDEVAMSYNLLNSDSGEGKI